MTDLATGTVTEAVIAAGVKPRRWGSWYIAEHRIRSMRTYLQTIIATSIGNPLVYLFALGVGLASLVDANTGGIDGVSYLAFVAPALLASAAVTVAAEECTYPMMMGFKWNPIFLAMNAAPISGNQITNGMVISVLARMVPTTMIYFVVMVLFGAVPSAWGVAMILVASLTGIAVGLVIMPYTASIEEDKGQMAMIQRFGILPMFLFSGTFFPLSELPIYLQPIGWISPLWHGTQLGRVVSYGMEEPIWLTVTHVLYLGILSFVGWRMTQRVVTRRLNK
jgi:lipooligosaccharide transport system permease protein